MLCELEREATSKRKEERVGRKKGERSKDTLIYARESEERSKDTLIY